jgi:hypothetical protein
MSFCWNLTHTSTIPGIIHEPSPFVKVNGKQEYEMEFVSD